MAFRFSLRCTVYGSQSSGVFEQAGVPVVVGAAVVVAGVVAVREGEAVGLGVEEAVGVRVRETGEGNRVVRCVSSSVGEAIWIRPRGPSAWESRKLPSTSRPEIPATRAPNTIPPNPEPL
jgi:hypothetical protein